MAGQRRLRPLAALASASLLFLATSSVFAQASASDKAAAEALFDQGVLLMKQKSYAEACPKLEESQRVDPAVGTLLYLAECYERTGRTASAWATFREAASAAGNTGQQDRARVADKRAKDLDAKISRLSVEVPPDVAKLPGVTVKRGNQRMEPALYGTPLPVDPGKYRIEASAPGYETYVSEVNVPAGGANATVRVPVLVKAADTGAPPAPSPVAASDAGQAQAPTPASSNNLTLGINDTRKTGAGLSGQQVVGLVIGGVGVVGLGVGSFFGVRAIARNSDAEEHCPRGALCDDAEGEKLTDQAQEAAVISNIAFAAGAALLATGGVLYLTGGREEPRSIKLVPMLLPGRATASISGRF
jgi:hypothetical protein